MDVKVWIIGSPCESAQILLFEHALPGASLLKIPVARGSEGPENCAYKAPVVFLIGIPRFLVEYVTQPRFYRRKIVKSESLGLSEMG